ncbi:conserved hypothetical protein [Talaromyces stipitatus ATCC 10500]|uniref:Uncharacterized protein n=1 Tax=Talaromyces stipitatus (strain ATCC 10500 / CBS 375.48 / QM 6759 / NRRL 1006) TaxID=441959 RepID=B8MEQ7_TALSN|nr:uncharacterized protein TSTA_019990 [Talaromyces stipitatus ATCC 10500]EED16940.1 conserved hypothetical protein [Talaromyces stipitatus ATCC 10500]
MFQKRALYIPFTILLITATIQLALVSRMVAFLHIQKTEVDSYHVLSNNATDHTANREDFYLHVLPEKLSLNQGHVTNGAAGYGLVLSIASLVANVFLRRDAYKKRHKSILLTITISLSLLVLFTLSALVYVVSVTYLTINNKIDMDVARAVSSKSQPYNIDSWTPETWYRALLLLPLEQDTIESLNSAHHEMVAWRWWVLFYHIVDSLVFWWTGMVLVRVWRKKRDSPSSEELVEYGVGYAGERRESRK